MREFAVNQGVYGIGTSSKSRIEGGYLLGSVCDVVEEGTEMLE